MTAGEARAPWSYLCCSTRVQELGKGVLSAVAGDLQHPGPGVPVSHHQLIVFLNRLQTVYTPLKKWGKTWFDGINLLHLHSHSCFSEGLVFKLSKHPAHHVLPSSSAQARRVLRPLMSGCEESASFKGTRLGKGQGVRFIQVRAAIADEAINNREDVICRRFSSEGGISLCGWYSSIV